MRTLGDTDASAAAEDCDSLILDFATTTIDKPPPARRASLRTLGDTGAAASAAALDSFIIVFATNIMSKLLISGSASLRTLGDLVPEVEDIKRMTSVHQNIEQISMKNSHEHLKFSISGI